MLQYTATKMRHQCNICQATFSRICALESHLSTHNIVKTEVLDEEEEVVCEPTVEGFSQNNKTYKCRDCSATFPAARKLREHTREHTAYEKTSLKCYFCSETFASKNDAWREHVVKEHTGENPYKCVICEKQFGRWKYFIVHAKTHSGIPRSKPHKCDKCDRAYQWNNQLQDHMNVHAGETPYKCDLCDESFAWKNNLNRHKREHETANDVKEEFKCETCGKNYVSKRNLVRHIHGVHTNEHPHVCEVCLKSFASPSALDEHRKTHTGEKPFKCTVCGDAFRNKTLLQYHTFKHTGEKPWICDTCGKAFIRKSLLVTHMLTHEGNTPYKCEVCGKEFLLPHHLRTHMITHTGERPHTCDVCGKGFGLKHHLRNHLATHIKRENNM